MQDLEQLIARVQEALTEHRFRHTQGVVQEAVRLARHYGADEHKAEVAGWVHDYAKQWPAERLRDYLLRFGLPRELLDYDKELWHAPVGAIAIQLDLGIQDLEVIEAVRYHTTGRAGMSLLEKVVCLADYMEPGRKFEGVEEIRQLAYQDLDLALCRALAGTIGFLASRHKPIHPDTLDAYNHLAQILAHRSA